MAVDEQTTVFVLGGSPCGIAAAVRSAREGIDTTLATHHSHLGGALPSLAGLDSFFEGYRAPLFQEFLGSLREHYRETYGEDSEQYEYATGAVTPHLSSFEPHVAEECFEELAGAESSLTVIRNVRLESVERDEAEIGALTVTSADGDDSYRFEADTFVDASYEGDLAAGAGVPYRVGRESRDDFGEQHAGKMFTNGGTEGGNIGAGEYSRDAAAGELNLKIWGEVSKEILSGSTGEGDDAVQAYCTRLCMTSDPDNRIPIEKPDNYDRSRYLGVVESPDEARDGGYQLHSRFLTHEAEDLQFPYSGPDLPNDKAGMNAGNLVGGADEYPEADWEEREEIIERHDNHALGLMYFMQNDDAVPEAVQAEANEWGLAADEFVENDHVPTHMYIREARRIDGRHVLTENDARVAPGLDRTPVHADAIATAGDWYMDSHSCTTDRVRGCMGDGKVLLTEVTRPFHVPFRSILPDRLENLLVPGALSATHVAWGAIRLEPTWMHIGESAGTVAALADEEGMRPADLDADVVQHRLLDGDVMLAFFNDLDMATDADWVAGVQYLGTKGFFDSYDARPDDPLRRATVREWVRTAVDLLADDLDATESARRLPDEESDAGVDADELLELFERELTYRGLDDVDLAAIEDVDGNLIRGEACQAIYEVVRAANS